MSVKLTKDQAIRLQNGLKMLGFLAVSEASDGIVGPKTEDAVIAFQENNELYGDGIVGPNTAAKYDSEVADQYKINFVVPSSTAQVVPGSKLKLVTVSADKLGRGGYTSMKMREDVAIDYNKLRDECLALGGGITTAGCIRPLSSGGGAAQSITSLHYCAIAMDLSLDSGMNRTDDPYIVCHDPNNPRKWIVWMRCTADSVASVDLDAVICSTVNGKTSLRIEKVSGKYVNFTELAVKYGFKNISCRKSFLSGGSYNGAEWWHFSYEKPLIKNVSTFGGELLRIYDEDTIKNNYKGDWNTSKSAVWGNDWN